MKKLYAIIDLGNDKEIDQFTTFSAEAARLSELRRLRVGEIEVRDGAFYTVLENEKFKSRD